MNFTINRNLFIEHLNIINLGISLKSPMKLLEGIKIETKLNKIILTSTCNDISIQTVIEDESLIIKEQGSTVVFGKVFIDMIKAFDSNEISIFLIEDKSLMIKAERKEYLINIMDVKDYPIIRFDLSDDHFDINSNIINKGINETVFACANNNIKQPVLNGLNFKFDNNLLILTATNSFRLSQKKITISNSYNSFDITLPSRSLDALQKILDFYSDSTVEIHLFDKKIIFKINNILFLTRILEGDYPNTSNIIPTNPKYQITFIKEELLTALNRTSLLSPSDKASERELMSTAISFKINNNNELELSSANYQGNGKEIVLPIEIKLDEDLSLGVSSKYLLEALKAIPSNEVVFSFINSNRQFTIKPKDDDSLIELILPFNLD